MQPANQFWGASDLLDVIPINRELDERMSDHADLIKYHADPPVVFKGVTDHSDLAEWSTQIRCGRWCTGTGFTVLGCGCRAVRGARLGTLG
jgi:hypothetical protein